MLTRSDVEKVWRALHGQNESTGLAASDEEWTGMQERLSKVLVVRPEGEETSSEIASLAARILGMETPKDDDITINDYSRLLVAAKRIAGSALTQTPDRDGKIVVFTDIDYEKVANAIVGATESGYSRWFSQFKVADDKLSDNLRDEIKGQDGIWYSDPTFWSRGGTAVLNYDIPDEDEGEMNGHLVFGKAEIQRGLQIMATKYPRHFADLMSENDDAETHDVFMQCAVLEDVVYG